MKQGLRMAISRLEVTLPSVLDLRSPKQLGIPEDAFFSSDYEHTQLIAAAAYGEGLAGLLAPTATGLGAAGGDYNVITFFEVTGGSKLVFGLAIPATAPRTSTIVQLLGVEELILPP
jgi:hypothetical protein